MKNDMITDVLPIVIGSMKCGEVISVRSERDGAIEYIVKAKWFQETIFIVGGNGTISPVVVPADGQPIYRQQIKYAPYLVVKLSSRKS